MTASRHSGEGLTVMRVLRGARDRIGAGIGLACGWVARRKRLLGKATTERSGARDDWRQLGEL